MTTNKMLLLNGIQWLGQGLVAKLKGLDRNRLPWLRGIQYCSEAIDF